MDGIRTPKCLTRTENSFDKKIKLDRNLECLGQKAVETLQVLGVKKLSKASVESFHELLNRGCRESTSVVSFWRLQHLKKWTII